MPRGVFDYKQQVCSWCLIGWMQRKRDFGMDILKQLINYIPFNEQEAADKALILHCLRELPDVFTRDNKLAHMTASGWVVNPGRDKVMMVYHNLYDSWSWMGGHADGDRDLLRVALREVQEESGIKQVRPLSEDIFSLEALTVNGHRKHGAYVSSHLHLNVTYLLEAREGQELIAKPDENSGVLWFGLEEAIERSNEEWFRKRIYPKLNEKLRIISNGKIS